MPRSVKFFALLAAGSVIGYTACQLPFLMNRTFGKRYSHGSAEDVSKLRKYTYVALPAIHAIDAHVRVHKKLPATLSEVEGVPAHYLDECFSDRQFPYWTYVVRDGGYWLRMKLNWDAALLFDSDTGTWGYDPGDGTEGWDINP